MERKPDPYGRPRLGLAALAGRFESGLVSIIIPCFNNGRFLREAIDSALAQSYRKVEVLVIDDGSVDDSLRVIQSYGDRVVWRTKKNMGATAARNDGLELARGEFIQFLDGDDVLLPDAVQCRLGAFGEGEDAVFGDMADIDAKGLPTGKEWRHGPPDWPPVDMRAYLILNNIRTPEPLHRRRNVYQIGGFDEGLPRSQEPDFHLRLFLAGHRFKHLSKCVCFYRQHEEASRIGNTKWLVSDPDRYPRLVRHWLHLFGDDREGAMRVLGRILYFKGGEAFRAGYPRVGKAYLQCLKSMFPEYRPQGAARIIVGLLGLRWGIRAEDLRRQVQNLVLKISKHRSWR